MFLLDLCLVTLSIFEREMLKFPAIITGVSICPLSPISFPSHFCRLFAAYTLRILMSFG